METELFDDILGHRALKEGLLYALSKRRLHHALLFIGIEGLGKTMLAKALIQAAMCAKTQLELGRIQRCRHCIHCKRIADNCHPDLLELREEGATIKIESIRELIGRLAYAPFEGGLRFVLIHEAHKMNEPSANALLKTLEEPDPNTRFILLSSQADKLLPTIVSRSQRLRFAPFSNDRLSQLLTQRGLSPDKAQVLAALSLGSLGEALKLANDQDVEDALPLFDDIISLPNTLDIFPLAARLKDKKHCYPKLLTMLSLYFRDLFVIHTAAPSPIHLPQAAQNAARKHYQRRDIAKAFELLDELYLAIQGHANLVLAWEHFLMGAYRVLAKA